MSEHVNVPAQVVRQQIIAVLETWGMRAEDAVTTADVLVAADLAGIDSHGVAMLTEYEVILADGGLDIRAVATTVRDTSVITVIDAHAGLGHPAATLGMQVAIDKALLSGIGAGSVFNSHHFGAAGYYASMASQRGLIGFVASTGRTVCVVPTRGSVPRLATNPLAFAAPSGSADQFLLDMSTSTVAANKVRVFDLNARDLPPGWVLDEAGNPVVDSTAAVARLAGQSAGGLAPLGGTEVMSSYKGYGLNVMVQILAGALSGATYAPLGAMHPGQPHNIGHFFLAIDPAAFRVDDAFTDDVAATLDILRSTPPIEADRPVLVAGDPEAAARRERTAHGIPIPVTLIDAIRALCDRAGVEFRLTD